jgi:hypothetical protein
MGHSSSFHIVASTGRTATSFIAECLDQLPGITTCHEGHQRNDDGNDLLPLINLENNAIYRSPASGSKTVEAKRSAKIITEACRNTGSAALIDVAYYNAMLAAPVLKAYPLSTVVAIIRDCESFVRSATWLSGTDPMPIGWPDPQKSLSDRERFISFGRIRPTSDEDLGLWANWGAIERNIWLWRETNLRLCDAKSTWPDRVTFIDFNKAKENMVDFLIKILISMNLYHQPTMQNKLESLVRPGAARTNKRKNGYHCGGATTWTASEQESLFYAEKVVRERRNEWTK